MSETRQVGARVEALLDELGAAPDPGIRERAEELVGLLVQLYGAGLERIVNVAGEEGPDGLVERLGEDPLVRSLMVLHGLHPVTADARIERALEEVRPYLGSHAGGVEYLGLDEEGVARLRLEGSCSGCPSSTVTVRMAIEKAILDAAPEVAAVEVEGMIEEPAPALLQIAPLGSGNGAVAAGSAEPAVPASAEPAAPARQWRTLEGLPPLLPGEVRGFEVEGASLLLCSARGTLYAYRNGCPGCGSSLEGARLDDVELACPSCSAGFDVRLAGRPLGDDGARLEPLPLLPEGGGWKVAVPSRATA